MRLGHGKFQKRGPHSIRFFDDEWTRIEAFASDRGLAPAEFVRFATLAALAEGAGRLTPLIESTFRATYILMLKLHHEMGDAGELEALDNLIGAAREMQDKLLGAASE